MASTIQVDKIEGRSASTITVPAGQTLDISSGTLTISTLEPTGDTSAGDNAAIGYTAAEGIIVTGQGSTSDITIKNDADADVLTVATGTTNVDIVGDVTASTVNADGDTSAGDGAAIGYTAAEGLILTGQGSTNDVTIKNDADGEVFGVPTGTTGVTFKGVIRTDDATDSTSGTSGSIQTDGGIGAVKDIVTDATFKPLGDTAASDAAAIGYTAAEGLILTGQGSTSDLTVKNDADAVVFTVPTGTDDILFPDDAKAMWGTDSDSEIYHNGSNMYVKNDTGNTLLYSDTFQFFSHTGSELFAQLNHNSACKLYYDSAIRFETTSTGANVKNTVTTDNNPALLTLQTGETDIAADDVLGKIAFQAPDEATGTDAILVAAAIQARSEGDFSSSSNATSIDFMTGSSEAAATRMSLTSAGTLNLNDNTLQRANLKDYGEVTSALGSAGGARTIDLEDGNSFSATVSASTVTWTFSNPTASDELCGFSLVLTNGGSQTVNWPAAVGWAGASAPTLTTSGVDILVFITIDGGTIWHGMIASADSS